MSKNAVIVGGGIAGLAAACELLEKGCNVTILEKNQNLGGNSSKATSGIAAPGNYLQKAAGVQDTGADLISEGPAAKELIQNGTKDVEWLLQLAGVQEEMTLRNSPGHTVARMLGTKEHFPGAVVTYAVVHQLEELLKKRPDRLKIQTSATVTKLITQGDKVVGVEYAAGSKQTAMGVVIIASGGFVGDSSPTSLLSQFQVPANLRNMPTTSDDRHDGSGIALAGQVGANLAKMDAVAITPLAAIIPGMEQEKFKVVISDTICGSGGKIINGTGDPVPSAEPAGPASSSFGPLVNATGDHTLLISGADAEAVQWLVDFYVSRKVMKKYGSASELAEEKGFPAAKLQVKPGPVYAATVTRALYTNIGGIQTVMGKVANVQGLFAAGEAALVEYPKIWATPGLPLLHCIHTGRMAGAGAAEAMGVKEKAENLAAITNSAPPAKKEQEEKKPEDMSMEELLAYAKKLEAGAVAAPAAAPAGPVGVTEAEVAKHNTKADGWVIINGEAIDVTKWIPIHPGGEKAIEAYLGKDATEEWNMIHKPGTVEKNAQHLKMMGKIGAGGGGGAPAAAGGGDGGIPISEVEKHNKKEDAWIILMGEALDVTKWIPIHPGGEQAIMAYLGKDATEEWVMIHKPGTVEKNLQHVTKKGKVSGASAAPVQAAAVDDEAPAPEGNGGIPGPVGAAIFLVKSVIVIAMKTVFFTGNFKFKLDNNRKGTIRSAVFLITFIIIHALGNFVDMLSGPQELNGEGYLFDRIHWTGGFGFVKDFPFSVVEEYLALALLLHISVALKRSWDISMNYTIATGRWNMMLSGLVILFFLINHLQDFRFYPYYDYVELYAPKYGIAFDGLLEGRIFVELPDSGAEKVVARDLYSREVVLFKDLNKVLFYTVCVLCFVTHLCLGWKKLIPADAMQIPRDHQTMVIYMGWVAALAVGGMYISVPWYVFFATPQEVKHVSP